MDDKHNQGDSSSPAAKAAARLNQKEETVINNLKQSKKIRNIEAEFLAEKEHNYGMIFVGPPRIGKSTLINGIMGEEICKTSSSIDACTVQVQELNFVVQLKNKDNETVRRGLTIYDTPGIENWRDFDTTMNDYFHNKRIIISFICLTAGCYANSEKLKALVLQLVQRKCYVCFVIVNMHNGADEQFGSIVNFYEKLITNLRWYNDTSKDPDPQNPRSILKTYGHHGLMCSLNTRDHQKDAVFHPPQNLQEMMETIFRNIDEEALEGLFLFAIKNRTFWEKLGHDSVAFFTESIPNAFEKITTGAANVFKVVDFFNQLATKWEKWDI